jgi:hypothetical protein
MARIYVRRKEPGKGWRYKAVPAGAGRRPTFDSESKFHVRYPDASGKFVYSEAYDTLEEAQRAAAELPTLAKAIAAGLTSWNKSVWSAPSPRIVLQSKLAECRAVFQRCHQR